MRNALVGALTILAMLPGTAVFAQLQNPGLSTTPGVTQNTGPNSASPNAVQNIQNLQVGPAPTNANGQGNPVPSLNFSSITVTNPVVYPYKFGSSNVLTTTSPQQPIAAPLPSAVSATSTTGSLTPTTGSFSFTPSPQFYPVQAPRPFQAPFQSPFVAK